MSYCKSSMLENEKSFQFMIWIFFQTGSRRFTVQCRAVTVPVT